MRDAGGVDRHVAALPNGRDSRAELPQHPGRALHVGSGQQAFELARAARQPRQHHGAVGDALVSWRPDDPVYLHASACRRHCAARLSHAVTARAFPVSSARSSSPSGSSRERSAGSNSSRFMRKISVQSAGSEAASRVASRAPGPNVAPGGATFGPGARDATRLAASEPALWTEIFLMNRDELLPALRSLEEPLGELERALETGNARAVTAWLRRAAQWRRQADA